MEPVIAQAQGRLPVQQACRLCKASRSEYYRHRRPAARQTSDASGLVEQIRSICLEMHGYGYRRVTAELHRRGMRVNHKRVLSLMHKAHVCCRPRRHRIRTTNSLHAFRVYPNLAKDLVVTRLNQLWVADITYVHLRRAFVYLAVVLDAFSRRAIGWALRQQLDAPLSMEALAMALRTRTVEPGLVHHSDRGIQYAAGEYIALLEQHHIAISMSRRGNPYDNAKAESFMKTLKHEKVLVNEYDVFDDALSNIGHFIGIVYNTKRLHSALNYRPPVEFEALCESQLSQTGSTLDTVLTVST